MNSTKDDRSGERELTGKIAVVTGGTRGMGRATAELLASAGASLAICSRDQAALDEVASEIKERHHVPVFALFTDILDVNSVDNFAQEVGKTYGRIDILVNNAGGSSQRAAKNVTRQIQVTDAFENELLPPGRFESMTDEEFMRAFDQKVLGMIRVTRAALPFLRRSNAGSIVNIASTKGLQPPVRVVTSGIVWSAVSNFSKSLSFELASDKIRVNLLCVDIVVTSQTEKSRSRWHPDESMDEFTTRRSIPIPLQRVGLPADIAEAIYFLVSPRASYITGQCIAIDGGGIRSY